MFETRSPLELMLEGYCLTTAEILYHLPDHPKLLQTYLWQEFDLSPKFPELKKFLDYWESHLDGKLHSVEIAHVKAISSSEMRTINHELTIH